MIWREVIIFIVLSSLLPFSRASILPDNCSQFSDWKLGECQNILSDSSLSLEQKQDLYLNLLESRGELASYYFVWSWNKGIVWNSPPSSVVPKSNGIIKNAWVKIIGVNKSYFDLNKAEWFAQPSGQVLSDYNFSIELPTETESGDCQTNYSYQVLNQDLGQKLNGNNLGSQRMVPYSVGLSDNASMVFSASLFLKARLQVEHFKDHKYCLFGEEDCFVRCEYDNTEYRDYSIDSSDAFTAKVELEDIRAKVFLEKHSNLSKLIVLLDSVKSVNGFDLNLGDNHFFWSEASFDLGTTNNAALFVEKSYSQNKGLNGFVELDANLAGAVRRFVLGTTSLGDCAFTIYSDFERYSTACNLVELKPVLLRVETDSNSFDFNQEVDVNVLLSNDSGVALADRKIVLQAGEKAIELTSDSEGVARASIPASDSKGTIVAKFDGDEEFGSEESVKRVSLFDLSALNTGEAVLGFFAGYYFIFLIAKKKLGLGV